MAEVIGMRKVLSWLKSINAGKLIVETDSQLVVNAMNRVELDFSSFGLVIDDCKLLADSLKQCKVVFARRSTNGVAHCLARTAISVSDWECWMSVPPPFILDVLLNDLI
ncbi:hypothetical protein LguiB_018786 [Lonicera macranthoides]